MIRSENSRGVRKGQRTRRFPSVLVGANKPDLNHSGFRTLMSPQHTAGPTLHPEDNPYALGSSPTANSQHPQFVQAAVILLQPGSFVILEVFNVLHHLRKKRLTEMDSPT